MHLPGATRVLVDECLPRRVAAALVGIDAVHVVGMGWAGKKNGELLDLAEGVFDVLLTIDQNIGHQQNLTGRRLSVLVMVSTSNRFDAPAPLFPSVVRALQKMPRGAIVHVGR